MADNERQNRAMKQLIDRWQSEGNFTKGYDISVHSIGGRKI